MKTRILIFSLFTVLCLAGCESFDNDPFNDNNSLFMNSTWELYGYKDAGLTQMLPLADTLEFGALPDYRYNKAMLRYDIHNATYGSQAIRLELRDTRFGTLMGVVQVASVKNGTILGETFDRPTGGDSRQLWFRKI